jgi:hypothetical protein
MKPIIIIFVAGLLAQPAIQAQGTLYLSNLGQPSTGSEAVGSNSWLAVDFNTGYNVGGYVLNSVQLGMTDASGNPNSFTVMLFAIDYKTPGGIYPGNSLGTLVGSANPSTAGIYTYADESDITLSPRTDYFIVLTAGTTVANGAYDWSFADLLPSGPASGWGGSYIYSSANGSHWNVLENPTSYPQFAVDATAVPEPQALSLLAVGGLGFLGHRRKAKSVQ